MINDKGTQSIRHPAHRYFLHPASQQRLQIYLVRLSYRQFVIAHIYMVPLLLCDLRQIYYMRLMYPRKYIGRQFLLQFPGSDQRQIRCMSAMYFYIVAQAFRKQNVFQRYLCAAAFGLYFNIGRVIPESVFTAVFEQ
jgi:hypothetical protein